MFEGNYFPLCVDSVGTKVSKTFKEWMTRTMVEGLKLNSSSTFNFSDSNTFGAFLFSRVGVGWRWGGGLVSKSDLSKNKTNLILVTQKLFRCQNWISKSSNFDESSLIWSVNGRVSVLLYVPHGTQHVSQIGVNYERLKNSLPIYTILDTLPSLLGEIYYHRFEGSSIIVRDIA